MLRESVISEPGLNGLVGNGISLKYLGRCSFDEPSDEFHSFFFCRREIAPEGIFGRLFNLDIHKSLSLFGSFISYDSLIAFENDALDVLRTLLILESIKELYRNRFIFVVCKCRDVDFFEICTFNYRYRVIALILADSELQVRIDVVVNVLLTCEQFNVTGEQKNRDSESTLSLLTKPRLRHVHPPDGMSM